MISVPFLLVGKINFGLSHCFRFSFLYFYHIEKEYAFNAHSFLDLKQRTADLFKISNSRVDDLRRNAEIFRKARLAHIFFGIAIDQTSVDGDLVTDQLFSALYTVSHIQILYFTFTSVPVNTLQSPAGMVASTYSFFTPRCSPVNASVTSKPQPQRGSRPIS